LNHPSGRTVVAGVIGSPVTHSLSPILHNAWLHAAGIDGVYVALSPTPERITTFFEGLRGGAVRGLNVTAPFKTQALASGTRVSERARRAGAANLLVFEADGEISADNTDGEGLLAAFAEQATCFHANAAPVAILGAGGAARGAAAAFLDAGAEVRVLARDLEKARALTAALGGARPYRLEDAAALRDVGAVINATPADSSADVSALPPTAVVMDMVYRPLETQLLGRARSRGLRTVDGLAMLIGQARPSFTAFFGAEPPDIDVRAVALKALETP